MMVDGDIEHHRAVPTSKIAEWLKNNARSVLEKFEDTQTNGIWVVTSTYVATRRTLAVLSSCESEFTWTIRAEAAGAGRIAPGTGWLNSRQDGAWVEHDDVNPHN